MSKTYPFTVILTGKAFLFIHLLLLASNPFHKANLAPLDIISSIDNNINV